MKAIDINEHSFEWIWSSNIRICDMDLLKIINKYVVHDATYTALVFFVHIAEGFMLENGNSFVKNKHYGSNVDWQVAGSTYHAAAGWLNYWLLAWLNYKYWTLQSLITNAISYYVNSCSQLFFFASQNWFTIWRLITISPRFVENTIIQKCTNVYSEENMVRSKLASNCLLVAHQILFLYIAF